MSILRVWVLNRSGPITRFQGFVMRHVQAVVSALVGFVVGVVVTAGLVPSAAAPDSTERVLVFGDSMTAQFTDDPGDPMQGWWSILGERHGLEMVTSAQGGGGLVKKGAGCYGTAIRERATKVISRVRPTIIIVAAGYNDDSVCGSDGRTKPTNAGWRAAEAVRVFERIGQAAEDAGMSRSDVVVTVPWGTLKLDKRTRVVIDYMTAARAAGLRFVNVRRFQVGETIDRTHPNRLGATLIADTLERTIATTLLSHDPAARTAPSPTASPAPTPTVSPEVELTPEIVPTPSVQGPPPPG